MDQPKKRVRFAVGVVWSRGSKLKIQIPERELSDFGQKWRIVELAVLGPALDDEFDPDSDLDALAVFQLDAKWSLL